MKYFELRVNLPFGAVQIVDAGINNNQPPSDIWKQLTESDQFSNAWIDPNFEKLRDWMYDLVGISAYMPPDKSLDDILGDAYPFLSEDQQEMNPLEIVRDEIDMIGGIENVIQSFEMVGNETYATPNNLRAYHSILNAMKASKEHKSLDDIIGDAYPFLHRALQEDVPLETVRNAIGAGRIKQAIISFESVGSEIPENAVTETNLRAYHSILDAMKASEAQHADIPPDKSLDDIIGDAYPFLHRALQEQVPLETVRNAIGAGRIKQAIISFESVGSEIPENDVTETNLRAYHSILDAMKASEAQHAGH